MQLIYARAESLFSHQSLLFCDVRVTVAGRGCLNSLILRRQMQQKKVTLSVLSDIPVEDKNPILDKAVVQLEAYSALMIGQQSSNLCDFKNNDSLNFQQQQIL